MITLLSPAKNLDLSPSPAGLPYTTPAMLEETEKLMVTARRLTKAKLAQLMSISDELAELNRQRFQDFSTPFTPDNAKQAALMFAGDTYRGFQATELGPEDLGWAQDHVAILSGLYGVLRPLDLMQPYRLEMGTSLATRRGKTLYRFWGDRIARELAARLEGHSSRVILNCASGEYFKAVDQKALGLPVVHCHFKEDRGGVLKIISFSAKRARGMMARHVVRHRVDDLAGVREFAEDGYAFRPDLSDDSNLTFVRPKPT